MPFEDHRLPRRRRSHSRSRSRGCLLDRAPHPTSLVFSNTAKPNKNQYSHPQEQNCSARLERLPRYGLQRPTVKHRKSFAAASRRVAVAISPRHFRPCRPVIYLLVSVSPSSGAKVQSGIWASFPARASPPSAKQPGPLIFVSPHSQIAACWSLL